MSESTPTTPPASGRDKRKIITIAGIALAVIAAILLAMFFYKQANPTTAPIPTVGTTVSVAPTASEVQDKPVIPGANSGANSGKKKTPKPSASSSPEPSITLAPGYESAPPDPQTGDQQVTGPDVTVPGVGNFDDGEHGNLTNNAPPETRSSDGDPISRELAAACPNMTSGTMCIPAINEVIYWHSVGIRDSTTGSGKVMAVPSTDTAGWLKDSAPLGASRGTSVFAAHVIFRGGVEGPFYNLNKLNTGDDIIMRDLNGKNYTYRVYKTTVTQGTEIPDEVYDYQGTHQLALVTCTGDYNDGHYNQRLIVWAAPVTG